MMKRIAYIFFTLLLATQFSIAQAADDILGEWMTQEDKARIEIYKEDGKYSGKIVWLKDGKNPDGTPALDTENPDESLRARPILGLDLIEGFTFEDDEWVDGEIYDPETGKTYECKMELKGDKLKVRGYIGISMFGRTVTWKKAK